MSADRKWRGIITLILLGFTAVVGWFALANIATVPTMQNGVETVNPFENAMLVLTPVLAAATLALGYWFGASGKEKAEETATEAKQVVAELSTDADDTKVSELRRTRPLAF
jgi:hypothetical protein